MEDQNQECETPKISKSENPFVFISHDSRDAEIAEAFSKLLKSVSAGMLKSFRSSDNKGTQGIEFGLEWYPKIIESLQKSSDVVCILTELSINRPWILFEAGMAKGKINTPILGIAVGIPLSNASSGPFAQFQNCDDDLNSLTKLVKQLVKKLPNSEPDEEVIKQQVEIFKNRTQDIITRRKEPTNVAQKEKTNENNESAKLFEEVKLMFKELPSRIENVSLKTNNRRIRRFHPNMINELFHYAFSRDMDPRIALQIALSPFKSDYPWIYESGLMLINKISKVKHIESTKAFRDFLELMEFTFDNPIFREIGCEDFDYRYVKEIPYLIEQYLTEVYRRNEMGGIR